MNGDRKLLLVGDNPFLGVSHLSQERARERDPEVTGATLAADLLTTSLDNEADGFLFSVSDLALEMLGTLRQRGRSADSALFAIAPWSFEYVRAAVRLGGIPGLAKEVGGRIVRSRNFYSVFSGVGAAARNDVASMFKAYMSYEISRVRAAAGREARLASVLLHEVVGDMALGLGLDWMFRAHIEANRRAGTQPGYNTRNLPLLATRFREWGIPLEGSVIAAPFNAEGFQMTPSKEACEATLAELDGSDVIAFSILAAGHLDYSEALRYIADLPNLRGVAVGISKPRHAQSTFRDLRHSFEQQAG